MSVTSRPETRISRVSLSRNILITRFFIYDRSILPQLNDAGLHHSNTQTHDDSNHPPRMATANNGRAGYLFGVIIIGLAG